MGGDANDITYAYLQLGIKAGATLAEIQAVLARAEAYRFSTKARVDHVRRFVEFFAAREKLGGINIPFADIRKAYRRKAMELHPDRNAGDKQSEDVLKDINNNYGLVEKIHQQAKIFYKKSAEEQTEMAQQARETTALERGGQPKPEPRVEPAKRGRAYRSTFTSPVGGKKYMAASVPRSIRTARLSYLPPHVIIGHGSVKRENDITYIYDYFMLPEDQFLRAKGYLSAPEIINPILQYGKFNPPYILKNTKEVFVPEGVRDAEAYARDYFRKEFGI